MALKDCVENCLRASSEPPPPNPSPYVHFLLGLGTVFVLLEPAISQWMVTKGLDPKDRADALLAMSIVARNAEGSTRGPLQTA